MIRVLIADDHKIVRDGLKRILSATGDVQVTAEAASGAEALALVKANDYDVAMLDMSMPGLSGIDLIKRLRIEKPKLKLLVLSMHGEHQYAARALKAGASGYLTKDSAAEQLVGAIRKIAAGGVHISEAAAASLVAGAGTGGPPHALSDREFEVLRLLASGLGPTEIAEQLHLSVKTVSTHRRASCRSSISAAPPSWCATPSSISCCSRNLPTPTLSALRLSRRAGCRQTAGMHVRDIVARRAAEA